MYELREASDSRDLNVYAVGDQFVVEVPVPGIKARDIEISLEGQTLTIKVQPNGMAAYSERTYLLHGYQPVSTTRQIQLPNGVDPRSGRGRLEVGLLRLNFRQGGEPRRHIPIRADGPAIVPLRRADMDDARPSPGTSASSEPGSSIKPGDCQPRRRAGGLLSPREQEVLRLMSDGRTNKEIARHLVISVATVNYHVASVLTKLGAENWT